MKRLIFTVFVTCSVMVAGMGQQIFDSPLSQRITGYNIDASLNPVKKTIDGKMQAFWVNISDDIVTDIQLHMYLNAFRSNKSTFNIKSGASPGSNPINYGWIDITSIYNRNGFDLSESMKFIQPDDDNSYDMTVLKIDLLQPAMPGDTVYLDIDFISKLPSNIRRTGYTDDFFFVAQWFPKIAVYEPAGLRHRKEGGWNCHQFHENSEFYANHSVYDVSITVPEEYVVGSGGLLLGEESTEEGLKTLKYRAEDIVDFAWTAWPEYKVAEDEWKHVKIRFMYPPGREDQVDRQIGAIKNALEYFDEHVGPYPWPYVTFVDPPNKGAGAGGMEYTTIFTSSSSFGMPEFIHMPEMVTVHEFGHAYFMGMLASNEFEEPWLDEGVNSYWEQRIMDHYWGEHSGMVDRPNFGFSDKSYQRMSYVRSDDRQVIDNTPDSWSYPHGTYGMMSYSKAATWLATLEGIIGTETMDDVFREYYREWGFNHPDAQNFVDVTNKVVSEELGDKFGKDMNWFFDQTLYGTGICDYKLDGIINSRKKGFKGIVKSDSGMVLQKDTVDTQMWTSAVKVQRIGEVMLPVDVLIHFDNGDEVTETWDGKARYNTYTYKGDKKVEWAIIDPERKLVMDVNYINNSYTLNPVKAPVKKQVRKLVTFLQLFIQTLSI